MQVHKIQSVIYPFFISFDCICQNDAPERHFYKKPRLRVKKASLFSDSDRMHYLDPITLIGFYQFDKKGLSIKKASWGMGGLDAFKAKSSEGLFNVHGLTVPCP